MPAPTFDDVFDVREHADRRRRSIPSSTLERGGERFDAILFRHAEPLPPRLHAAYRPEVNDWQGTTSLELTIEHWWPAP